MPARREAIECDELGRANDWADWDAILGAPVRRPLVACEGADDCEGHLTCEARSHWIYLLGLHAEGGATRAMIELERHPGEACSRWDRQDGCHGTARPAVNVTQCCIDVDASSGRVHAARFTQTGPLGV